MGMDLTINSIVRSIPILRFTSALEGIVLPYSNRCRSLLLYV